MKTLGTIAAAMSVFGLATTAAAATVDTTFLVTANVAASCSVTSTDLAFGQYDPFSATPRDASTTIQVTCTNGQTYGMSVNGGPTGRSMAGPAPSTLSYGLFNDTGRTTPFFAAAASLTGTGSAVPHSVYGRIPAGQTSAVVGNYQDSVTITVTY